MRIIIITQEEHLYLPKMLDRIFSGWQKEDFTGIVILEGETSSKNFRKYIGILTFREMLCFSGLLLKNKLVGILDKIAYYKLANQYSVESVATKHGVSVYKTSNINSKEFIEKLDSLKMDLIISIAAPQIFKKHLLHLPKFGCINIHCSLLPMYRGMLPTFWVLALGEKETGVTIHYMNENLDDGDIILQERVPIHEKDTFHSLVTRLKADVAPRLLLKALENMEKGTVEPTENNRKCASYFSFPQKEDIKQLRKNGRRFC